MTRVADVLGWVDDIAPFRFAAPWDNCGLLAGDPAAPCPRALAALDVTSETLAEAEALGCGAIVSHHPLIFSPQKAVRADVFPGGLLMRAIRAGVALIAAHTNLDCARGGTNERLAAVVGIRGAAPLEADPAHAGDPLYAGMGLVGALFAPETLAALAGRLASALGAPAPRIVGDPGRVLSRAALCTGSGGSLIETALACGADVYITGDLKYHEAARAGEAGLSLLDCGHFATEVLAVPFLAEALGLRAAHDGAALQMFVSSRERDPFRPRPGGAETHPTTGR